MRTGYTLGRGRGVLGLDRILLRRYASFLAVELISSPKVIFRC